MFEGVVKQKSQRKIYHADMDLLPNPYRLISVSNSIVISNPSNSAEKIMSTILFQAKQN